MHFIAKRPSRIYPKANTHDGNYDVHIPPPLIPFLFVFISPLGSGVVTRRPLVLQMIHINPDDHKTTGSDGEGKD